MATIFIVRLSYLLFPNHSPQSAVQLPKTSSAKLFQSHSKRQTPNLQTHFHTSPNWTLDYTARSTYGSMLTSPTWPTTSPLDAKFWHRVTEVFEKDRSAFDVYQGLRKGPGQGVEQIACADDECWKDTICELRGMNAQYACRRSTPGLNIRRRDENGTEYLSRVHANAECAGAGISHVFHELPGKKVCFSPRTRCMYLTPPRTPLTGTPCGQRSMLLSRRLRRLKARGRLTND